MTTAHADAISELVEVLDRFAEITDGATRACGERDLKLIERALDARDVVLARVHEIAPVLQAAPLPSVLRARLADVERADRDLAAAMARAREETRGELNAIGAQTERVGRYAAVVPRSRRLDVRR